MGVMYDVIGMVYFYDMSVEENVNYIFFFYLYWKIIGDDVFMRGFFGKVRFYICFIFNCDSDGDGFLDLNVVNIID